MHVKFVQKKLKGLEKQLTTLEEIIVHSNNQIKVSLKDKSELIVQLNLDVLQQVCIYLASDNDRMYSCLLQQCHGIYSCMNEAVESIMYLLGVEG